LNSFESKATTQRLVALYDDIKTDSLTKNTTPPPPKTKKVAMRRANMPLAQQRRGDLYELVDVQQGKQ
jgi:hypothetical protein